MTCDEIAPRLDELIDGSITPAERAQVEEHLAGCDRCRAELAAIRGLVADARALPRSIQPPGALWRGIEARLTSAGAAPAPRGRRPIPLRFMLRLAAALALVALGGALATVWQRHGGPSQFAVEQQRYAEATAQLARELARNPTGLSPTTLAVVQRNLSIVDQAIHESETALAADPGNHALEQMLLARYQQRLSLLRRATAAARQES
jgi:hypothetical protein